MDLANPADKLCADHRTALTNALSSRKLVVSADTLTAAMAEVMAVALRTHGMAIHSRGVCAMCYVRDNLSRQNTLVTVADTIDAGVTRYAAKVQR